MNQKKKDNNKIQKIDNRTSEKSTSYTLEHTEYLQRKIENITQYLKPYISKLNESLQINSDNVKIICDYIITEQNELNIKESTKETNLKAKIDHSILYFDRLPLLTSKG